MKLSYLLTLWAILGLLMLRNNLTSRMIQRRIKEITDYCDARNIDPDYHRQLLKQIPPYEMMMFDLRIWTYNQFFPNAVY